MHKQDVGRAEWSRAVMSRMPKRELIVACNLLGSGGES